ncbi:hypothetical protein AB0C22_13710 [Micromonospora sp. NPDC048894]|uniref:hypothetical protein n=1 Tax=Micromonospora sp. NPDC048894 TaxID=3155493 RepID=UPI0033D7CA65
MVLLPALRTRDEADIYLDLRPCPRCGSMETAWRDGPVTVRSRRAHRYAGRCADCDENREFLFEVSEDGDGPAPPGPRPRTRFGGDGPSLLLDPGEWMLVADWCVEAWSSSDARGDDTGAADSLWTAVAAIEEVRKFLPADGEAVPESAFWSVRGRTVYHREPGRFRRRRLQVLLDLYLNRVPWVPS